MSAEQIKLTITVLSLGMNVFFVIDLLVRMESKKLEKEREAMEGEMRKEREMLILEAKVKVLEKFMAEQKLKNS